MYPNEEDDFDEQAICASDDEIGFVAIKEESPKKIALVSHVEKKFEWIIDSGCSHHIHWGFPLAKVSLVNKIWCYELSLCMVIITI